MEYIVAGNVMLDSVRLAAGGEMSRESIGGPATFAYSGIKLWTDNVLQCSNVGADYKELFDPWVQKNNIETRGFKVKSAQSNHTYLIYHEDGTYGGDPEKGGFGFEWLVNMGYLKTSADEIGVFTAEGGVKGVYVAQDLDRVFWDKLAALKARDGFKVMWEIEGQVAVKKCMEDVLYAMKTTDIFSINIQEAESLFEVEGEEACIRELQKLDVDVTLFRVGARGLYSVTAKDAIYLPPAPGPVVDPTGCGNTSTGSALYAYAEGYDPLMIGIMANVASSQNIRQYGVIPDFAAVREEAYAQAKELYQHYKK